MVRTTKAEKQTVAPVAPVENVVVEAAAPKKTKKAAATATAPVVAAPVPAPVPEPVVAESTEQTIFDKLSEYGAKIQQISNLLTTLKNDYKTLEKNVVRELKTAQKLSSKKKKTSSGNRAPSGFTMPTLISDELAAFLGKENGTKMARTVVSKELNNYIKENNLKDKANGKIIHPDKKLAELLRIPPNEQLHFFNLQRYMKVLFPKTPVNATVATA